MSPECSHDVNELSVSLTSYANFVVKGFFSITVVKEMQVLLTTHKSLILSRSLPMRKFRLHFFGKGLKSSRPGLSMD